MQDIYNLGFNRISLGVQTLNEKEFNALGRGHEFNEIMQSIDITKNSKFNNINGDLIFGLPHQTLETW